MRELRVAIIGGGFMGRAHSLAYGLASFAGDTGAVFVRDTLVDVTMEKAADSASRFGWARHSDSWEEVVTREGIDIVDICTPPDLHERIAMAAIAQGKSVFCEKPMTNDLAGAERMRDAASAAGCVAQVGFNYSFTPAVRFAKHLLDSGRLGEPLQFRGAYLQEAAFGADPDRWRAKSSTGGSGMVTDIGSHIVNVAELLFGDITRVSALVRAKSPGDGAGWVSERQRVDDGLLDDAGVWIAEFSNGALGSFAINSFASGRMNQLSFGFDASKGAVDFDWNEREEFRVSYVDEPADHHGFRTIHTNNQHPNGWWRLAGLGTGYVDVMAIQFQEFARAILNGGGAQPDFADGARTQRVIEAVKESARTGVWVNTASFAPAVT